MEESAEIARSGKRPQVPHQANLNSSGAIVEGAPVCYYPRANGLKGPVGYGRRVEWIEGKRAAFGFFEVPGEFEATSEHSHYE